jgi:hypothetical protein
MNRGKTEAALHINRKPGETMEAGRAGQAAQPGGQRHGRSPWRVWICGGSALQRLCVQSNSGGVPEPEIFRESLLRQNKNTGGFICNYDINGIKYKMNVMRSMID